MQHTNPGHAGPFPVASLHNANPTSPTSASMAGAHALRSPASPVVGPIELIPSVTNPENLPCLPEIPPIQVGRIQLDLSLLLSIQMQICKSLCDKVFMKCCMQNFDVGSPVPLRIKGSLSTTTFHHECLCTNELHMNICVQILDTCQGSRKLQIEL